MQVLPSTARRQLLQPLPAASERSTRGRRRLNRAREATEQAGSDRGCGLSGVAGLQPRAEGRVRKAACGAGGGAGRRAARGGANKIRSGNALGRGSMGGSDGDWGMGWGDGD